MSPSAGGAFRSLRIYNYRLWAGGGLVSNVGAWMQRTAQDWVVLTQLTHHNATAMGTVMALQFGPMFLLLPVTGYAADHLDRRKLLLATQTAMGVLALVLGVLLLTHTVALWHVYGLAFLQGCATAFDAPARQTFVADLVGEDQLSNAVALNSTSFNAARLIGPAIAGLLIAAVGSGWVFVINAASFLAVIVALGFLRLHELNPRPRPSRGPGALVEGFRYVWRRPDLRAVAFMLFLIGTFGLNFPIFISTMSVTVFHGDARQYGVLSSIMAIGSVSGALMAARRKRPRMTLILAGAAMFGVGFSVAAFMPTYWLFGLALIFIGASSQTFTTSALSTAQLATEPHMRGRVMALILAVAIGGTPIGAPVVGWAVDTFGARWALAVGAAAGFGAALVGLQYLLTHRGLRLSREGGGWRLSVEDEAAPPAR